MHSVSNIALSLALISLTDLAFISAVTTAFQRSANEVDYDSPLWLWETVDLLSHDHEISGGLLDFIRESHLQESEKSRPCVA